MFPRSGEMAGLEDTHIIPCCYARYMMKHVANLKACIFIYPYLNQPFTFPRFANSDRWFADPNGAAA